MKSRCTAAASGSKHDQLLLLPSSSHERIRQDRGMSRVHALEGLTSVPFSLHFFGVLAAICFAW
jgi:hypothetical protein